MTNEDINQLELQQEEAKFDRATAAKLAEKIDLLLAEHEDEQQQEMRTTADQFNPQAPEGQIWECQACGRRSRNKYNSTEGCNWDESCMLNSVLVPLDAPRVGLYKL